MDLGRGGEVEDDLFFADLSKRISLLIMEEEEEFPGNYPQVSIQGYSHAPHPFFAPPPFLYESAATYRSTSTKGTGVFFPRSSLPRKKNRPGRSKVHGEKARAAASIIHHPAAASKKHTQNTTATEHASLSSIH